MRVPIDFRSAIAFWQFADTCGNEGKKGEEKKKREKREKEKRGRLWKISVA